MTYDTVPDYLVIGHVAKDNVPNGAILGGTCSYAALTAHKLGQQTVAVTSYGPDLPSMAALAGIEVKNVPHKQSTTFENVYQAGQRHQKWLTSAASITLEDIPAAWQQAAIIHLAPLSQEMSPRLCGDFFEITQSRGSLLGVTMQGWLRGQDPDYNVIYQSHPELEIWLPKVDVMILSLADLFGDRAATTRLLTSVKLGVETLGADGCRIYSEGKIIHVPVRPEAEVDPTGAGDIFAAAFLVQYNQTGDPVKAARFANSCASLSVQGMGMDSIPSLAEVENHLVELYSP